MKYYIPFIGYAIAVYEWRKAIRVYEAALKNRQPTRKLYELYEATWSAYEKTWTGCFVLLATLGMGYVIIFIATFFW